MSFEVHLLAKCRLSRDAAGDIEPFGKSPPQQQHQHHSHKPIGRKELLFLSDICIETELCKFLRAYAENEKDQNER